jgi:hypothetical protein
VRLATSILWWSRLDAYTPLPVRIYLSVSALIWLGAGLVVFILLLRGFRKALELAASTAIAFTVWYWSDRWFLAMPRANWGFSLAVTILFLICVILCTRHPGTRHFFLQREKYEEESENR